MPKIGAQRVGDRTWHWYIEQCAPYPQGECITDVRIYRVWEDPLGHQKRRDAALTQKKGKGGRLELWVHLPAGNWSAWGQVRLSRVVGWYFGRKPSSLLWKHFCEVSAGQFLWQVDHLDRDCRVDVADNLEVVRAATNRARYAANPKAHIGVRKRPARA